MRPVASLLAFALGLSLILVNPLSAGVNRWTSEGPFGGRIDEMAVDAFDPELVYAASRSDLYRSVDGGETWRRVLTDHGKLEELVVHPTRSGEAYFVSFGGGILRTTDRGASWKRILDCGGRDLVFDPSNPDVLLTVCGGLLRSPDGGETWILLSEPDFLVKELAIDPVDADVVYAAFAGIQRSSDGGETFSPTGADFGIVDELLFDPADSSRLLARAGGAIHVSDDGGATWNVLLLSGSTMCDLVAHPGTARLWAAGRSVGLQTSSDGGATWQERAGSPVGVGPCSIALDPLDPDRLFVGTALGVFHTTNGGQTWQPSHEGIDAVSVWDVLPGAPIGAPGGTSDGLAEDRPLLLATSVGVLRGGREVPGDLLESFPSSGTESSTGRIVRLAAGRISPHLVYAASPGLWRSEDGGGSWTRLRHTGGIFTDLEVAAYAPTTVFLAQAKVATEVSFDAGDTWTRVALPAFQRVEIGLAHSLDPRAYAIFDQTLYVSDDLVEFVASGTPPPGVPSFVEADPHYPGRLFVETSEGWFRSVDSGTTWDSAGAGLPGPEAPEFSPPPTLAFHPGDPDLLYSATFDGVFASIDGGDTWASLGSELSGILVHDVEIDPQDGNRLLAGTEHGLFTFDRVADLSLRDGRFRVEVEWKNFEGLRGAGLVATVPGESTAGPVPLRTRDSTIFRFFRPENWEAQLKILDGRAINGHFWVFFSAATNVGYELRVTDTVCGGMQTYGKAEGPPAPAITHGEAFPACPGAGSAPSCDPGPGVVCLGPDDRFRAELEWTFEGEGGEAFQVTIPEAGLARSEDSGVFRFFDGGNWEVLVKVLDGCPLNDRFWMFAAASTDVEYTLRVTDTVAETTRTYENPLGRRAPAINDVDAFPGCDL